MELSVFDPVRLYSWLIVLIGVFRPFYVLVDFQDPVDSLLNLMLRGLVP
ncbi:MAG: hypothetical protein QXI35_08930 [Candidatus Nezhaarchaeales archaeon]